MDENLESEYNDFSKMEPERLEPPPNPQQISEDEFQCLCCFELMVEPATLTCGHSFCRICVARWFLQIKKCECPQCRQTWTGNPLVNLTLRSSIERLFGDHYQERKNELEDVTYRETLSLFDTKIQELNRTRIDPSAEDVIRKALPYVKGIIGAVLAYLVLCAFQYVSGSLSESPLHKPVLKWSTDDVQLWLCELGPWAEEELVPKFQKNDIDGRLLMVLTEDELSNFLESAPALHQRAFMHSLDSLKELGTKPPESLWQYRDMHLGWTMLLLHSLTSYPRSTLFALYLFGYEDAFLPFIHVTCPAIDEIAYVSFYSYQFPDPILRQWVDFLVKLVVLPYVMIMQFAWNSGNTWIDTLCVTTFCAIRTSFEADAFIKLVRNGFPRNFVRQQSWKLYYHLRNAAIAVLFWPFIPTFLCNWNFSYVIYTQPFTSGLSLYKALYVNR